MPRTWVIGASGQGESIHNLLDRSGPDKYGSENSLTGKKRRISGEMLLHSSGPFMSDLGTVYRVPVTAGLLEEELGAFRTFGCVNSDLVPPEHLRLNSCSILVPEDHVPDEDEYLEDDA